jgi:transposase InsO family protein
VIPPEICERIRACYLAHYGQWGPRVLAAWCRRQGLGRYSATTIAAVIADLRQPEEPLPPPIRYEVTAANVMWSEDGTGFRQGGRKRELLVVQDEHARLKLNWRLVDGPATTADVHRYLQEAFDRYGAPLVLKHDGDGIFHTAEIRQLLNDHQVVELTIPAGYPGYNGKQERSMRDIKSYERALRRHGVRGSLGKRIDITMQDLNEERPRPVLGGRTAREVYEKGNILSIRHRNFITEVERRERELAKDATSRQQLKAARRLAVEQMLLGYGLLKIEGDVSLDFTSEWRTE